MSTSATSSLVSNIIESQMLVGTLPDFELRVKPRWLIFSEKDAYKRAQFSTFTVQNRDSARICFRFKTKDKNLMMFTPGHGFLEANESCEVTVVIGEHEGWFKDASKCVGRIHKAADCRKCDSEPELATSGGRLQKEGTVPQYFQINTRSIDSTAGSVIRIAENWSSMSTSATSSLVSNIIESQMLVGTLPDFELRVKPRWLIFSEKDAYKRAQFSTFTVQNRDSARICFRFKTKVHTGHGFLEANESCEVTVVIGEHEGWFKDASKCVGRIHKVIVENVIVNPSLQLPEDVCKKKELCRSIFKSTREALTQQQGAVSIYTKMKIVLPNYDFSSNC
uniref:Major sperm protein n=1 Tax=Ditylenchus dipsaci TaxID=166011 RepID=A0A915DHT1_9BILA